MYWYLYGQRDCGYAQHSNLNLRTFEVSSPLGTSVRRVGTAEYCCIVHIKVDAIETSTSIMEGTVRRVSSLPTCTAELAAQ